jgi:hypothetical protein
VFTRRPVPDEAEFPMIIVNDPAALSDEDGLTRTARSGWATWRFTAARPRRERRRTRRESSSRSRSGCAALFHRQKWALQVGGFHVIDIRASGPVPAPVDDDKTIGRIVSLIVRLGRNA